MNKIFQTKEGRDAFIDLVRRRFNPDAKLFLGKVASKNVKECFDAFLYEADKDSDHENAIRLVPYFDTFHTK